MLTKPYDIETKIYNVHLIVKDIKQFPHTYSSLLGDKYSKPCSYNTLLRKKLNKMLMEGMICKTTIPGTRSNQVIFYHHDKKYNIVCVSDRIATKVYCFFEYTKVNKFHIEIKNFYKLNSKSRWEKKNTTKQIFEGNVLKFL